MLLLFLLLSLWLPPPPNLYEHGYKEGQDMNDNYNTDLLIDAEELLEAFIREGRREGSSHVFKRYPQPADIPAQGTVLEYRCAHANV